MGYPLKKNEEEVHIKGDPKQGVVGGYDFVQHRVGVVPLRYSDPSGDLIIECDVFCIDGKYSIHSFCPRCKNSIKIESDRKSIDFDKSKNAVFVEAFTCPWELEGEVRRMEFGLGLCGLRLAYDGNIARKA